MTSRMAFEPASIAASWTGAAMVYRQRCVKACEGV